MNMHPIEGINLLGIDGPWYVQLGVAFSLLIAGSTVLRLIVWPFFRKIWSAIIAAPRIADGVGRLVELLETDIIHRVETLEVRVDTAEHKTNTIEANVSANNARLNAHDQRADANETRMGIIEYIVKGRDDAHTAPK